VWGNSEMMITAGKTKYVKTTFKEHVYCTSKLRLANLKTPHNECLLSLRADCWDSDRYHRYQKEKTWTTEDLAAKKAMFITGHATCILSYINFIHSFSILFDDMSKASAKMIPPHSAI
jgi:hypothetical protein